MRALIEYCCTNAAHVAGPSDDLVDRLTLYRKKWAFCPANIFLEGHVWTPTGGSTLEAVLLEHRLADEPLRDGERLEA